MVPKFRRWMTYISAQWEALRAFARSYLPTVSGALGLAKDHDLIDRAAALALFSMLTFVPALFGALSALGFFFERMAQAARAAGLSVNDSQGAVERATEVLQQALPGVTWDPSLLVQALMADRATNASLSTATALMLGLTLFSRVDNSVRVLFGRRRRSPWRAAGFFGLFFMGGSLIALILSVAAPMLDWGAQLAERGLGGIVGGNVSAWAPYIAVSQILPIAVGFFVLVGWSAGRKRLARRRLLWASGGFGALWFMGQRVFSVYVSQIIEMNAVYGTISGVVALMLWLYYAALVFLFTVAMLAAAERNANPADSGEKSALTKAT